MHQNQWLVRSSGRILGPFSTEEVIRRLESRNISLIDEISAPFSRWTYIRDRQPFVAVAEKISSESYLTKEDTKTATVSGHTQTKTPIHMSESHVEGGFKDIRPSEVKVTGKRRPLKSYGHKGSDSSIQTIWSKLLWVFVVLMALVLVASWYTGFFRKQSNPATGGDYLQRAHIAMETGHFSVAKDLYAKAALKFPNDPEILLNYAALLIDAGEVVKGQRVAEKVYGFQISGETRRKADVLIGLAAMKSEDLKEAAAYLERHVDEKGRGTIFVPAAFNLSMLSSISGDFARADQILRMVLDSRKKNDTSLLPFVYTNDGFFYRALNLALQYKKNKVARNLPSAQASAKEAAAKSSRFRLQSNLLLAWIDTKLRRPKSAYQNIEKFLDLDPKLSESHVYSLFVFNDYVSWKSLYWFCNDMAKSLKRTARFSAALALCAYKSGNTQQFRKLLKDATAKGGNDSLVRAVESYLLIESKDFGRAETVLKVAMASEKIYSLPYLLKGRNCWAKKNKKCAQKSFQVAFNKNPSDIVALTGLIRYYLSLGEQPASADTEMSGKQMAASLIEKAYRIAPSYEPLIELKKQMDAL